MTAETVIVPAADLESRVGAALRAARASEPSLRAAVRAMMHASLAGLHHHGVGLTLDFCHMLRTGRVNRAPYLSIDQKGAASATVDGDDGMGAYAAYHAVALACDMARETGIGSVGIRRSPLPGAAGGYAVEIARQGMIGIVTRGPGTVATSDPARPAMPALAIAAPVEASAPWIYDSEAPRTDADGHLTPPAQPGEMPIPSPATPYPLTPSIGGDAAIVGVASLLGGLLTGSSPPDADGPVSDRESGTVPASTSLFVLAISPDHFAGRTSFHAGICRHLEEVQRVRLPAASSPSHRAAQLRDTTGIPLDWATARFLGYPV